MADRAPQPSDEEIRAYLERNSSAFGEFLRREIRRDPGWWDRMRRRQERIEGGRIRPW